MRHEMKGSIADNAKLIQALIDEEDRNWIPSGSVEDFNFRWSQLRDLNGRFVSPDWNDKYLYFNRDDWYEVTVQKCQYGKLTYYFVYVEKDRTDEIRNDPRELVKDNQWICHTFRRVRSLRHAMKLGEFGSEMFLGLANYDDYFLTRDERDHAFEETEK